MTTLTLAKLAEIEAAAAKATLNPPSWYLKSDLPDLFPDVNEATFVSLCDPATVAALCRVARAGLAIRNYELYGGPCFQKWDKHYDALYDALRDAGLIPNE